LAFRYLLSSYTNKGHGPLKICLWNPECPCTPGWEPLVKHTFQKYGSARVNENHSRRSYFTSFRSIPTYYDMILLAISLFLHKNLHEICNR